MGIRRCYFRLRASLGAHDITEELDDNPDHCPRQFGAWACSSDLNFFEPAKHVEQANEY